MSRAHVVFVIDANAAVAPVLAAARRFAPTLQHLHVIALLGGGAAGGGGQTAGPLRSGSHPRRPAELERVFSELAASADFQLTFEEAFDAAEVALAAHRAGASLVVVGPWPGVSARARALSVLQLSARYGMDVLVVGAKSEVKEGPLCVAVDPESAALAQTARALRELPGAPLTLLLRGPASEHAQLTLQALFAERPLHWGLVPNGSPEEIVAAAAARDARALVVPLADVSTTAALMGSIFSPEVLADAPMPVLVLHPETQRSPLFAARLTATDTLRLPGHPFTVLLERESPLGRAEVPEDERFFLVGAEERGPLSHQGGEVSVPEAWVPAHATGLALCSVDAPAPVAHARIVGGRPLVLLDAGFPLEGLGDVEAFAAEHTVVVVRLRSHETVEAVRARFDQAVPWGGPVPVLDGSAWLDDGGAGDLPEAVDGVRLVRLGQRLVTLGAPVVAVVLSAGPRVPASTFTTWTPEALRRRSPTAALSAPPVEVKDEETRWRVLTAAPLVHGHQVRLELDNDAARRRLLQSVAEARRRVHWQSYMVDDDAVAAEVAEAFKAAGARGVEVRVLVDALYSLHDAFGVKNPLLQRLAQCPGVEVRAAQPLAGLPGLIDLKQRNHRKLSCIDGRLATVSGRNLGAPYYRGFEGVKLSRATRFDEVPWFDAGVVVEGPLVEAVERTFLHDWERAGGDGFPIEPCAPAGPMACRWVVHQGLADAYAFEAQLELVRSAQRRVVLVNTFPLVLELQRALEAALRRGVKVQVLFGSVRPRWGDAQPFEGGAYRAVADELVRARLAPVLKAGAEGYEYTVPVEGLGPVFTHVHAKLLVRDEDAVVVGSANVDGTSAYWESEAVLVVHDAGFARGTLAQLAPLLAAAHPVDLTAGAWREDEARRAWLSRVWPTLIP